MSFTIPCGDAKSPTMQHIVGLFLPAYFLLIGIIFCSFTRLVILLEVNDNISCSCALCSDDFLV